MSLTTFFLLAHTVPPNASRWCYSMLQIDRAVTETCINCFILDTWKQYNEQWKKIGIKLGLIWWIKLIWGIFCLLHNLQVQINISRPLSHIGSHSILSWNTNLYNSSFKLSLPSYEICYTNKSYNYYNYDNNYYYDYIILLIILLTL